ncbi:MAG: hypothetical protein V4819_22355 [Verrucomicrobiota bacterium]
MRLLTAILALCGSIWAFMGLGSFLLIYWLLEDLETKTDVIKLVGSTILIPSGYFVWWGWVFYSFKKRFPFVTQRTFWTLSLVHHILCAIFLIPTYVTYVRSDGDGPWPMPAWIIGNVVIAAVVLARHPWSEIQAEQVGDGDAGRAV